MKQTLKQKEKWSGFCQSLCFCHSCFHPSLQGWIPPMLETKHSTAEREEADGKTSLDTDCPAEQCSLGKALECWYSPWRRGDSRMLKRDPSWKEDHNYRMTEWLSVVVLPQPATKHHTVAHSSPPPVGWGRKSGKEAKPVGWDKNSLIEKKKLIMIMITLIKWQQQ